MRIAVSGSACQGKSTFIQNFIKEWPQYKHPTETYKEHIKAKGLKLNKETTKETQWEILNFQIDQLQKHGNKGDKVIFDRCPLDNIVYSIRANALEPEKFDDEFINKCIPLVRESMRYLDIIFFTPITKVSPVPIIKRENRETDEVFIKEIDNIFKTIIYQFQKTGASTFFSKDDSPGVIEIFGSPEERIQLVRYYLNADGDLIGDEASIFNTLDEKTIQQLLNEQRDILGKEKQEKDLIKKIIMP
jgi:hypothetical protein